MLRLRRRPADLPHKRGICPYFRIGFSSSLRHTSLFMIGFLFLVLGRNLSVKHFHFEWSFGTGGL